jgi:DNA-binding GntR family transcriptional regulator
MVPETTPSTLKLHLVQKLQEAVLTGKYKPGERLNESLIAREFRLSRIPVREALAQLQDSGLLMKHERRGMFVTALSEEEAQKMSSVRLILETEALKLARARMTPEIASTLTSLVNKMEAWRGTLGEAAALDLEFHQTLWEAAGNSYLTKALTDLVTVLFAHTTLEHISHEMRRWRLNHHRALLEVVLNPADVDVQAAVSMHLRMAFKDPFQYSSLSKTGPSPLSMQRKSIPQSRREEGKPVRSRGRKPVAVAD